MPYPYPYPYPPNPCRAVLKFRHQHADHPWATTLAVGVGVGVGTGASPLAALLAKPSSALVGRQMTSMDAVLRSSAFGWGVRVACCVSLLLSVVAVVTVVCSDKLDFLLPGSFNFSLNIY